MILSIFWHFWDLFKSISVPCKIGRRANLAVFLLIVKKLTLQNWILFKLAEACWDRFFSINSKLYSLCNGTKNLYCPCLPSEIKLLKNSIHSWSHVTKQFPKNFRSSKITKSYHLFFNFLMNMTWYFFLYVLEKILFFILRAIFI